MKSRPDGVSLKLGPTEKNLEKTQKKEPPKQTLV